LQLVHCTCRVSRTLDPLLLAKAGSANTRKTFWIVSRKGGDMCHEHRSAPIFASILSFIFRLSYHIRPYLFLYLSRYGNFTYGTLPSLPLHPFMSTCTALRTAFTVSIHLSPRLIHVTSFFLHIASCCFTQPWPVSFGLSYLHHAALHSIAWPQAISIASPHLLTVRSRTCHVDSLRLRTMSLEYIS
jgi:hypothetical protein